MMKILLRTENGNLHEDYVHDEHECDTYDFLKNHENKHELCKSKLYNPKDFITIEWFWIELTTKDIEAIKQTAWYHNLRDTAIVDNFLVAGTTIEVVYYEYNARTDKFAQFNGE